MIDPRVALNTPRGRKINATTAETLTMTGRIDRIIADYVNGLRGEMSLDAAAELRLDILREMLEPSEGIRPKASQEFWRQWRYVLEGILNEPKD